VREVVTRARGRIHHRVMNLDARAEVLELADDVDDPMGPVPGVDALDHRNAVFLGGPGVDGGFIDDDGPRLDRPTHGFAGLDQGREVRPAVFIDGGRPT